MSDDRLRAAERAAHLREPGARERLNMERIRLGAPDPRVDPTRGAEVVSRGVTRGVLRVWPGRLAISLPVVDAARWGDVVTPPTWLPRGAAVLSVFPLGSEVRDGERRTVTWDVVAKLHEGVLPDGGSWVRVVTAEEPEVYSTDNVIWRDAPPLPVEVVEWCHSGATRGRKPQRSTLLAWRRWAKGGTVVWLGGAP